MTVEGSSSDARDVRAPALASRHVVCFEESGDCTLERIAREAREGDAVLVFGPSAWVEALREFGLATGVAVDRRARVAGVWRFDERRAEQSHNVSTIAYGLQAWRIAGGAAVRAPFPSDLPNTPCWPEGRRARIRRELGLAPHERAVLVGCERPETVDLTFISRAVGMAIVGGAPLRLVVSPVTPRWQEVDAFLRTAAQCKGTIVDPRAERPWELLPALDGCILDRDGALERPDICRGWRRAESLPRTEMEAGDSVSAQPALWALACGLQTFAHASINLGLHASHPRVTRFDRNVAELARIM